MIRRMERSTIHVMAKRGKSIRQIAGELGRSPTTIARVLHEPADKPPTHVIANRNWTPIEQRLKLGLTPGCRRFEGSKSRGPILTSPIPVATRSSAIWSSTSDVNSPMRGRLERLLILRSDQRHPTS